MLAGCSPGNHLAKLAVSRPSAAILCRARSDNSKLLALGKAMPCNKPHGSSQASTSGFAAADLSQVHHWECLEQAHPVQTYDQLRVRFCQEAWRLEKRTLWRQPRIGAMHTHMRTCSSIAFAVVSDPVQGKQIARSLARTNSDLGRSPDQLPC